MKVNKTILVGAIFILLAGIIFLTDALNPLIRPITQIFLMGSSKGKDIIFFGLLGLFLILSQLIKKDIDTIKYLKISIGLGAVLMIFGILLEVIFRLQMGIGLNTVFCSMTNGMSSTSILHTHLIKSILGEALTNFMAPFIQSDINTGVGLYAYLPNFAYLAVLLIAVLFATIIMSIQKHPWPTSILIAFFSSCLIIGIVDGGMFATPSYIGLFGLFLVYMVGYHVTSIIGISLNDENLIEKNEATWSTYKKHQFKGKRQCRNYYIVAIVIIAVIILRFTIAFAGAEPDYYTVDIVNPTGEVDLGNITSMVISESNSSSNKITYHIDPNYNEMQLINDLKVPLNNSCEYYTVSWNIYSYLIQ